MSANFNPSPTSDVYLGQDVRGWSMEQTQGLSPLHTLQVLVNYSRQLPSVAGMGAVRVKATLLLFPSVHEQKNESGSILLSVPNKQALTQVHRLKNLTIFISLNPHLTFVMVAEGLMKAPQGGHLTVPITPCQSSLVLKLPGSEMNWGRSNVVKH